MKYLRVIGLLIVGIVVFCFWGRPPISVTWRTSLLESDSKVMQVTNRRGQETLVLQLEVVNSELKQDRSYTFKVGPGATEELGILEMNWKFMPGETYSLRADGYLLPVTGTVP